MRYVIYVMIGLGFVNAEPYAALPGYQKPFVIFAWPALVTRDLINEASKRGTS